MAPLLSETPDPPTRAAPMLGNRYAVVDRIGKGGAAGVYLVHDRNLARWRAAKVLHRRFAENTELRTRFLREARTMARLDHPNIVRVLDVADVDVPYMVMEYVSGGCVLDWLREHGAMPPFMAVRVMTDVCKALGATHELGIVHRDVKPHNILVTRKGVCKLTDYGIAKLGPDDPGWDVDEHKTATGASMGTDAFMAPEQRQDAATVDHLADVYSVGATLFTLVTRKAAVDLCMLPPDHEKFGPLPEGLRDVVVKACHRRKESRYPSVGDLEEALHGVLWSLPSVPTSCPSLVRPGPELPRRPPAELSPEQQEQLDDLFSVDAPVHIDEDSEFTLGDVDDMETEQSGVTRPVREAGPEGASEDSTPTAPGVVLEAEGPPVAMLVGALVSVVAAIAFLAWFALG